MKKRILSILLVLCMVLAIMPVAAMAADGDPVYLDTSNGVDTNDGMSAAAPVQTLGKALELAGTDGTIYVMRQVSITQDTTLENVTFKRADGCSSNVFSVGSNAALTLNNVTIDGGNVDTYNFLVYVSYGTLNIGEGTKLTNNKNSAVYAYEAELNLTGGEISGNTVTDNAGGAVCAFDSVINLSGTKICNNTASWAGGLYVDGCELTLSGGEISSNTAEDYGGGGIFALDSSITLSGTTIQNNVSESEGAGIYMETYGGSAKLTMTGGAVLNNETYGYAGGGIYVAMSSPEDDEATVKVSGGKIAGNIIGKDDDPQYESAITLSDYYWDDFDFENDEEPTADTPFASLELSGSPDISGDVTLAGYYAGGPVITVTGDFTPVRPVVVDSTYGSYPIIKFAEGVTPNAASFARPGVNQGLIMNEDGSLEEVTLIRVRFYQCTPPDNSYTATDVYVYPDQPLDENVIPAAADVTGYQRTGWQQYSNGTWVDWDMSADVTKQISLYEKWAVIAVTGVTLDKTELSLTVGETGSLIATVAPEDALDQTVTWSSDNEAVATVDANGVVTAVAPGTATITVTTGNGLAATCTVTVKANPADYSAVEAAKAKVPADLTVYTDETVKALNDALAAVQTGLTADQQATVDGWAKAIEDAIAALEKKPAEEEPCDGGANCPSKPYVDVDQSAWYHEYVDYVIKNGYMIGVSTDPLTFATDEHITRAQVVQTLYQMEGEPKYSKTASYPDLNTTAWYMDAISWATENGIVEGRDTGVFDPDADITREELVTVLYRYAKEYKELSVATADGIPSTYTDRAKVGGFAEAAFAWAIDREIVNGMTITTLEPQTAARRCEMAKMITMLCKAYPDVP